MPTYAYRCRCGAEWDVIKRMADLDAFEACPQCCAAGDRQISRVNFNGAADWNNQSWNPALGCYTKSTAHARQIAKAKGMEEIGTENPDKIHAHFEKQQAETKAQRWADADRVKVYGD